MELGILLTTVILFALVLATIAGVAAARVLMHAADTRSSRAGEFDDR